jgi:hypothetical protein
VLACAAFASLAGGADLPTYQTDLVFERPPMLAPGIHDRTWLTLPIELSEAKRTLFGVGSVETVIDERERWPLPAGQTPAVVTVAFNGGSPGRRAEIATLARLWAEHAHLKFDFGGPDGTGPYRTWSEHDVSRQPVADIRIGFERALGHFSVIGRQAITRMPGNRATMNLAGFDLALPSNWKYIVLHEFGHALGLRHELQHPDQKCDLRWENDHDYEFTVNKDNVAIPDSNQRRPGIYTVMLSSNNWLPADVDRNLGVIRNTTGLIITPFDRSSVMLYPMEPWLFESAESECIGVGEPTLSQRDIAAVATLYPKTEAARQNQLEKFKLTEKSAANLRDRRTLVSPRE